MHTIGTAAKLSGVNIETIRYYERVGVVPPPGRTASGRRVYDTESVSRLRFVKRCRELGFPIPEIKSLLGLTYGSPTSCAQAREIGDAHLAAVHEKIRDLKRMERALSDLIELCGNGERECPMLKQLFAE